MYPEQVNSEWNRPIPVETLKHLRAVESLGISNPLVSRILAVSEFTNQSAEPNYCTQYAIIVHPKS